MGSLRRWTWSTGALDLVQRRLERPVTSFRRFFRNATIRGFPLYEKNAQIV